MAEDRAASRGASSKGRTHHLMMDRLTLRAIQSVASAFFFFSWQWELARQVAANSPLCLPQLLQNDPFGRTALGAPTSGLRLTGCSAVVICVWLQFARMCHFHPNGFNSDAFVWKSNYCCYLAELRGAYCRAGERAHRPICVGESRPALR